MRIMRAYYNEHMERLMVRWRLDLPPSWTYLVLASFWCVLMAVSSFHRLCPPSLRLVSGAEITAQNVKSGN